MLLRPAFDGNVEIFRRIDGVYESGLDLRDTLLVPDPGDRFCEDRWAAGWYCRQQRNIVYRVSVEGRSLHPTVCAAAHSTHFLAEHNGVYGESLAKTRENDEGEKFVELAAVGLQLFSSMDRNQYFETSSGRCVISHCFTVLLKTFEGQLRLLMTALSFSGFFRSVRGLRRVGLLKQVPRWLWLCPVRRYAGHLCFRSRAFLMLFFFLDINHITLNVWMIKTMTTPCDWNGVLRTDDEKKILL